jgi:hypothetical protein
MSGAKTGTVMQEIISDGVRSTLEEDRVGRGCEQSALRRRVVGELLELWKLLDRDGGTEVEECRAEAQGIVEDGADLEDKFDVLFDLVLVEDLDMLRKGMRRECEAHEWKAFPVRAEAEGMELQFCNLCEPGCGLDEEEARAMAAGRVVCGEWSDGEAAEWLERLAAGGCCESGVVEAERVAVAR